MASTGVSRIEGIDPYVAEKAPCKVATTANITLSGAQTVNGVAVAETTPKTRVFVRVQTDATENGIYDVMDTAWVRSDDFNGTRDVVDGTTVFVNDGTTLANSLWRVDVTDPVTFGTTSIAFSQLNAISTTSPANFATVTLLKAATDTSAGNLYSTTEHTATYGYEGGNVYLARAVTGGTDDNGSLIKSTGNANIEFVALFPNGVNDKHFGAAHDNTTDDTVAVMAAYTYTRDNSLPLEICAGDIYITDQGGTGVALDWSVDSAGKSLKINMQGTFQYKGGTGIALRIGQGPNPTNDSIFNGLRVKATVQSPSENLVGVGIRLVEVGESTFNNCFVSGFREGYSLRPDTNPSAVVGCIFNECSSEDCYYNIYIEPDGTTDGCFVTDNKWYGGRHTTPPGNFTDIVTADAHLISIRNPGRLTQSGNTVDGNMFHSVKVEQRVTRKVYCEGNGNHFIGCYFDAGTYSIGGTHAAGVYPYRQSNITGFTSDGDSTIHKVGHGLGAYVRKGDLINISSAVDISDNGNYVVVAVTDDAIQLNKPVVGVGSLTTIQHFSADIEFSATGNRNVIDSSVCGLQVTTSVATTQDNQIRNAGMGLVSGALPPLGTKGDDAFPGGITDAPQPGLINMWAPTITGAGTINAYLGNINDHDTNANVQLCFGALDDSQRQQVVASIMMNKEGRNTAQPHGGIGFRTRAAGTNSFLVDRTYVDSNGTVSYSVTNAITANAGGGQANATQLYARYNNVSTVASGGDSVKLPPKVGPIDGATLTIWNNGANAMDVFPHSGGDLGAGTDTAASLASGSSITYVRISSVTWASL